MTLTELLAVLLILSLLATIAVPVYTARQEDARIRVAQAETREIGMAEEQVGVIHGFYVPLQVLDDTPVSQNGVNTLPPTGIINEQIDRDATFGPTLYVIPISIPSNVIMTRPQAQLDWGVNGPPAGTLAFGASRVSDMVLHWEGPFLTFHRYWYDPDAGYNPGDQQYYTSGDQFRDYPLDPWGNPYRFYSPQGIIGSVDDEIFNPLDAQRQWSDGLLTDDDTDEQRFTRYAVVSYGRDGISDGQAITAGPTAYHDDIYYEFGTDGLNQNAGRF